MNQSLFLEYDKKGFLTTRSGSIGVIRNPYERLVSLYRDSWDWSGFEVWIKDNEIEGQWSLYKDCDYIISLEHWEQDLIALNVEPKNSSILMDQTFSDDWKRWYGKGLLDVVYPLVSKDLTTYGYSF